MRKYLAILILFFVCMPSFAAKKKYVDPRDTLQYAHEYTKAGKQCLLGLNFSGNTLSIYTYKAKKDKWLYATGPLNYYVPANDSATREFVDSVSYVTLEDGVDYVVFSYLDTFADGKTLEYSTCACSYDAASNEVVSFTGKRLPSAEGEFRIEGTSNVSMLEEPGRAVVVYLDSLLSGDSRFVVLPEDVYLTDSSIEWWLEHNPNALTTAKKVNMGALPEECSAVAAFKAVKDKEKNSRFQVASVDVRGYTLVIVRNMKMNAYTLVWAEPVCVNRKTDRRLVNVYFTDENTLAMVYYKGNSVFKYRIGLASRTIQR